MKRYSVIIGFLSLIVNAVCNANKIPEDSLNEYLGNYYLAEKCPSGIGMKMSNIQVKGCLRSVNYWTDLNTVIFDYILFSTSEHVGEFANKNKIEREGALKIETIALGYSVGKLKPEKILIPNGSIQLTPISFITKSGKDLEETNLKNWVKDNSVISLTLVYENKWYVGFINKDGSFSYKESYDFDPQDPVVTPLDFLKESTKDEN